MLIYKWCLVRCLYLCLPFSILSGIRWLKLWYILKLSLEFKVGVCWEAHWQFSEWMFSFWRKKKWRFRHSWKLLDCAPHNTILRWSSKSPIWAFWSFSPRQKIPKRQVRTFREPKVNVIKVVEVDYTVPLGIKKCLSLVPGKPSETSFILPSTKYCVKLQ